MGKSLAWYLSNSSREDSPTRLQNYGNIPHGGETKGRREQMAQLLEVWRQWLGVCIFAEALFYDLQRVYGILWVFKGLHRLTLALWPIPGLTIWRTWLRCDGAGAVSRFALVGSFIWV